MIGDTMKKNISILYIIYLDKFAEIFVDFLNKEFPDHDSRFIIYGKKHQFKFKADNSQLIFTDSYKNIDKNSQEYKWAENSDAIIFSGIFGAEKLFLKFPKDSCKKSYFHFWGGDFYDLREKLPFTKLKDKLSNAVRIHYTKKVKGVINLIPGDYDELQKIVKTNAQHFVAPVCGNDDIIEYQESLFSLDKSENPVRICLGNSASKTNNHIEALELLSRYKNENIRIICPLSYGNKDYANEVITCGKKIFGDKFEPLTDYMAKKEYFKILSDCKIGIFNNDRQQAMGNINALLAMGAKVYMKSNTSMWNMYTNEKGYTLYDIEKIPDYSFDKFIEFEKSTAADNFEKIKRYRDMGYKKKQWQTIFDVIYRDATE